MGLSNGKFGIRGCGGNSRDLYGLRNRGEIVQRVGRDATIGGESGDSHWVVGLLVVGFSDGQVFWTRMRRGNTSAALELQGAVR